MGSLVIDETTFNSERDVVEGRAASARARVALWPLVLSRSQHGQLSACTRTGAPASARSKTLTPPRLRTCARFHATYYRPDNAVLVVAGNFDEAQLNRGSISISARSPRPARAIPRDDRGRAGAHAAARIHRLCAERAAAGGRRSPIRSRHRPAPISPALDRCSTRSWRRANPRGSTMRWSTTSRSPRRCSPISKPRRIRAPTRCRRILSEGKTADQGLPRLQAEIARVRDERGDPSRTGRSQERDRHRRPSQGRETAYGRANEIADAVIRYGDAAYADQFARRRASHHRRRRAARRAHDLRRQPPRRHPLSAESKRPAAHRRHASPTSPTIQARALTIPAIGNADLHAGAGRPAPGSRLPPARRSSARIPERRSARSTTACASSSRRTAPCR